MTRSYYSHGNVCPRCGEPITNGSRMCRKCVQAFFLWLFRIYGYRPKLGRRPVPASKSERSRLATLDALGDGPLSTPELAKATGKTVEGMRYACRVLLEQGHVQKLDDGYRHIWALADNQGYDNAALGY